MKTTTYQEALRVHTEFEATRKTAIADLVGQRDKLDDMIRELEGLGRKSKERPVERKCGKCGKSGHSSRTCPEK